MKACKTPKEKTQTINAALKAVKIHDLVFAASTIGNSILEIYFPAPEKEKIMNLLQAQNIKIFNEFDINRPSCYETKEKDHNTKKIQRLAHILTRARLINLKKCILKGLTPLDREAVERIAQKNLEALSAKHNIPENANQEMDLQDTEAVEHTAEQPSEALSANQNIPENANQEMEIQDTEAVEHTAEQPSEALLANQNNPENDNQEMEIQSC